MNIKPNCCAVVVAAGNSERMALGYSKQFIPLCGVPAIIRTLSAFEAADFIHSVIVVGRENDFDELKRYIKEFRLEKVAAIVNGGATRQQSVAAGIAAVPEDAEYFAIHDGARALITPEEINLVVQDGFEHRASSLAVPVKDTIKLVDKKAYVLETPDRSSIWAVQTPQVFERRLYQTAMDQAQTSGANYTDDCQLIENLGVRVHMCKGEYTNIKITTREDICYAEAIVKCREEIR
jgi:2-C-methyl-D-erythritol 4-phosphate cytidylyltransferase